MRFIIEPYVGVGPIRFGMSVQEIRDILAVEVRSVKKTPKSGMPTDFFHSIGLSVHYKQPGRCKAVELVTPAVPTFRGQGLLGRPFNALRDWIETIDDSIEIHDTGLTSYLFGIGLYVPSARKSPSAPVDSVIVFEEGYYDR